VESEAKLNAVNADTRSETGSAAGSTGRVATDAQSLVADELASGAHTASEAHTASVTRPAQAGEATKSGELADKLDEHIRSLLQRDLVFVNPDLALKVAKAMWKQIYARIDEQPKPETLARFSLHTAYVIERLVRNEGLLHPYAEQLAVRYAWEWAVLSEAWQPIQDAFRLPLNLHELAYLFEIVFADRRIEVFD